MVEPATTAVISVAKRSATWLSGRYDNKRSALPSYRPIIGHVLSASANWYGELYVSTTPLGEPVVPEVKMIVKGSVCLGSWMCASGSCCSIKSSQRKLSAASGCEP